MIPIPTNEPILNYLPGSKERDRITEAISKARAEKSELPMVIHGKKIYTQNKIKVCPPHDHQHILGYINEGAGENVNQAIEASLYVKKKWENLHWLSRVSIFLKAAELIAGPYRAKINAATILGQSKNLYQAEIDSACELIDFFRFNAKYVEEIYSIQPSSSPGIWNQMEYRPLEGFVFALTPFNFTAIAGNLPCAPAMLGNTVVWKPAYTQAYSANVIMEVLMEAGLPDGVINLIYVDGPTAGEIIFKHTEFAGIHFTGSTSVFQHIWSDIGKNISMYKSYPRIVGETGGKDFVMADTSADIKSLVTALVRGAFEYQGQKCSAASRAYLPMEIWDEIKDNIKETLLHVKMGPPEDYSNFINAVIDEKAFDKITRYISQAKSDKEAEIIAGGNFDKSIGYFIEPTVILAKTADHPLLCEEIFGPVLTVYLYPEKDFIKTLEIINQSKYALTGAIFSKIKQNVELAKSYLYHAAGNLYINDKPTGAVVGQQPFGGGRASGTNDKAGSILNLLRWVSPRVIKENFVPPTDFLYPYMKG